MDNIFKLFADRGWAIEGDFKTAHCHHSLAKNPPPVLLNICAYFRRVKRPEQVTGKNVLYFK
jgi:hypothetical protein